MLDGTNINIDRVGPAPQPGPQTMFLSNNADIAVYGGAAGGGKSYALLLEAARHIDNADYGAVIFRREAIQITNEGGLLDTSFNMYSSVDATLRFSPHRQWVFPSGATVTFSHLHNQSDVNDWQGSQIPMIGYDELTHFTEWQFWYMFSRNRSTCGVRPYIRATCNPDADSWVAELISWWIDQESGYPIPARSGVIRYVVRVDGQLRWADTAKELLVEYPGSIPKSFTFIAATLADNKILTNSDPNYEANLRMLNRVEQERLLKGNWKIRPVKGSYFPSHCVGVLPTSPADVRVWVRRWDLAATEPNETNPNPNATASVLMGRRDNGRFVIANATNITKAAHVVREAIKNTASQDRNDYGIRVITVLPQDPGQAGKEQAANMAVMLAGYRVETIRETGPKTTRAEPLSAQWQMGNVDIVEGTWNKEYLSQMESFPSGNVNDDLVDASSGAFLKCIEGANVDARRRALAE